MNFLPLQVDPKDQDKRKERGQVKSQAGQLMVGHAVDVRRTIICDHGALDLGHLVIGRLSRLLLPFASRHEDCRAQEYERTGSCRFGIRIAPSSL